MTTALDIRPEHLAIVRAVLRAHLPDGVRAYVFGSRAQGGARAYSDLDLAVDGNGPLGFDVTGRIAEDLSESDLPYKVDLLDLALTDASFRERIARDWVELAF